MMKRLLFLLALLGSPAYAADNYAATEGSGKTFRCVDVAGVCYPVFTPANASGTNWVYGNGVTGAASPRVTIASDNTAFSVNATLGTETTKVIGTVNQGTSPWVTSGGGTAGSAAAAVTTVQGIASMTPILATITGAGIGVTQRPDNVDGVAASGTQNNFAVINRNTVFNGTTWDRLPGSTLGMYDVIRDAAGNARGANVNASNQLAVAGPVTVVSGGVASGGFASGAMVDLLTFQGTKNAGTAAANALLTGGVYNSSPLTLTTTQQSSLQLDANGYLKVNTVAGGGSGGTALADEGAFTQGTTNTTPMGCLYATSLTNLTAGQAGVVTCTNNRTMNVTVVNTNANGSATSANSSPVVIASDQAAVSVKAAGSAYETVAASQTAQAMGATGATGDYLSHCVVTPGTTSPGVVTILDNATAVVSFAGGASSVSNLVPFTIPIGALSVSGAWKLTTGSNVTVVCVGRFT